MPSRRLMDGLLVTVARRVRRWADQILAERDRALREAQEAPPGGEDRSETEPIAGEGPPAHWLEMVRARAPHLLSALERSPRSASPLTRSRPLPPRSAVAEAPVDPTQEDRGMGSPAPGYPSLLSAQLARPPVSPPTELAEAPPRAEPPAAVWRSPPAMGSSPPAPSRSSEGPRAMRVDPAAGSAGGPAIPEPPPERTRWRWWSEAAGEPAPARWRGDSSPARSPVPHEATPQQPPRPHAPRPLVRGPIPPGPAAPAPWRVSGPDALAAAAPLPTGMLAGVVAAASSGPASSGVAPATAPSAPPPGAGAGPLEAPTPAVTRAGAAPVDEPPPRSFDPVLPWSLRERPPAPPVVWPHLSVPDDDELRRGDAARRPGAWPPPPARSDLWPRLPDEDDLPPPARPTDPPWPALPSEALEALGAVEEPAYDDDHGRSDRLRGEQQGARWSGRHF